MTKSEFNILGFEEKRNLVFEKGLRVVSIIEGNFYSTLFLVSNFFVEVSFCLSRKQDTSIVIVSEDIKLTRYLKCF